MEKVLGEYWVIHKTSMRGGEQVITKTLNFTTKEKADEYYNNHIDENTWYEHMNPPTLKVIKIDFID